MRALEDDAVDLQAQTGNGVVWKAGDSDFETPRSSSRMKWSTSWSNSIVEKRSKNLADLEGRRQDDRPDRRPIVQTRRVAAPRYLDELMGDFATAGSRMLAPPAAARPARTSADGNGPRVPGEREVPGRVRSRVGNSCEYDVMGLCAFGNRPK